ncbi:MAG TPA: RNB domain-containing ribonuclease [Solirubrobacteraceae bacterium]|nr:RNB domain-containing ribonuclease [Solirubrobacteraceae bacterium]
MSDAYVAVLERHGRFLTAEPLFPRSRAQAPALAHGRPRRERPARVTLGPARAGGVRANAGELVLVQAASRKGGAHVVRRLGRPDVARDVIEALLLDRGLRREFPEALEGEARAAGERVRRAPGERRDLRHLPTFTIDPASARDFDDAISAQPLAGREGEGAACVWVHIADVAAHVPEGSALDREARRRATSVYAPGAVEPMLPHALSSDACSLMPGVDRAAVSVELHMQGARVVRAVFHRSLIRSDARLDYEQVDRIFAGAEPAAAPWADALALARETAAALESQRERAGALVVESEEPEFEFDEQGQVAAVLPRAQTESHRLVEHLMIAANEAVAGLLQRREIPCLYRVHERPEPERVRRLADQLASLEVPTPALPERMSSSQAAELVADMSRRVERHVRRTGHGRQALGSLVLRSLMQAYYSPKNIGHAGLRSPCYCHFTSPIRRYPDLVCHRALLSSLGAPERAPRAGELGELGAWTSEREREAMVIERDADDVARCFALVRALRELGHEHVFAGEVTGLIGAGAFVSFSASGSRAEGGGPAGELAGADFEGMLPVRALRGPAPARAATGGAGGRGGAPGARRGAHGRSAAGRGAGARGQEQGAREWWELNEQGTILLGERSGSTVRLGDEIRVRVDGVDVIRGRVDLVPAP